MASSMRMTAPRVPFAPLNEARLQNLTSIKNRQNAISSVSTSIKRKATAFESDLELDPDTENVNPALLLAKKSKNTIVETIKKPTYTLKAAGTKTRPIATTHTPEITKPVVQIVNPAPRSAPAGRSPTRQRAGLFNRRTTASPYAYTRVDPPSFGHVSNTSAIPNGLSFSISAALSSTTPTTATATRSMAVAAPKIQSSSWQFAIYEDSPEEHATNLMEHSTCVLDISSDEESAICKRDLRGKENVPPEGDVSQTRWTSSSRHARTARKVDATGVRIEEIEIDRKVLGEMDVKDFRTEGTAEVIVVPEDEDAHEDTVETTQHATAPAHSRDPLLITGPGFIANARVNSDAPCSTYIDAIMSKANEDVNGAPQARLLEPLEKAEEDFELWESESAKDVVA